MKVFVRNTSLDGKPLTGDGDVFAAAGAESPIFRRDLPVVRFDSPLIRMTNTGYVASL